MGLPSFGRHTIGCSPAVQRGLAKSLPPHGGSVPPQGPLSVGVEVLLALVLQGGRPPAFTRHRLHHSGAEWLSHPPSHLPTLVCPENIGTKDRYAKEGIFTVQYRQVTLDGDFLYRFKDDLILKLFSIGRIGTALYMKNNIICNLFLDKMVSRQHNAG